MYRSRDNKDFSPENRRRRSISTDRDSGEERERRRRRREKEDYDYRSGRSARDEEHRRYTSHRNKYDDHARKRHRSRSPADKSSKSRGRGRESSHRDIDRAPRESRDDRPRYKSKDAEEMENKVPRKRNGPLPSQEASYSMTEDLSGAVVLAEDKPMPEKQKPSIAPSGLLAAASNTVQQADGTAIILKYHEPPEARKPPSKDQWKLFVFKGKDIIDTIDLSLRSCWLFGRELSVVDLAAEHPSISKQHAVIQFRYIEKKNEYGDKLGKVKPYLIDLESANGTKLNKETIPSSRYLELRDTDMIQFGDSTREYVLMLPPKE